MDILDRYIFRHFLKVFAGTFVLLTGLAIIIKILDSVKNFTENKHGISLLIQYYLFSTPAFITYVVPPALMFAISFTISQFNRHFEITVILAAGRSFRRILRPILFFTAFFTVVFFLFNEFVAFPSAYKATDTSYKLRNSAPDVWLRKYERSDNMTLRFGNRFYTIGHGAWYQNELLGLHLLELSPQYTIIRIIEAERAKVADPNSHHWQLQQARVTNFTEQGAYIGTQSYPTLAIDLPENLKTFQNFYVETDAEERSIFDAYRVYLKRRTSGGTYEPFLTEIFWHAGYPLVCLFIIFIGGMLGGRLRKGGIALSITIAMLFTLVYFFFMYFGNAFGENGILPPFLAGNLANIIAGIATIWILFRFDY